MPIQIIDNFELGAQKPIDNRFVVGPGQFYTDKNDITHKYTGLRVWDLTSGLPGVPYVWDGSSWQTEASSGISGSGTPTFIPKFISPGNVISDSIIKEVSSNIGIGLAGTPTAKLHVNGNIRSDGAGGFYGFGTNLTNLNASNITTGTLGLAFLQNGTSGFILTAGSSPTWTNPSGINVGSSDQSDKVYHVLDTSTNAYRQLLFLESATSTGYHSLRNSGSLTFRPDNSSLRLNGYMGINTTPSTSYRLSVNGTSYLNGNVGIGTIPGTPNLTVSGTTKLGNSSGDARLAIGYNSSNNNIQFDISSGSSRIRFNSVGSITAGPSDFTQFDTYFSIKTSGRTYFNTINSGDRLVTFGRDGNNDQIWFIMDNSPAVVPLIGGKGVYIKNNIRIDGTLSKGSGSFQIEHPLESKKETHTLVHSFIEGPQADNIYRGKVDLKSGKAEINIDENSNMTNGTFEALNREIQCFTSNETGWDSVKGTVIGNILKIESSNNESSDTISWLVIGERKDKHMYETNWTDENGKVIVEPLIISNKLKDYTKD